MVVRIAPIVALMIAGMMAPSPVVGALSGRYSHHRKEGQVNGPDYWVDDVAEIVPVDESHAYFRLHSQFYNGHVCAISGVAQAQGDELVYTGSASDTFAGGGPCRLTLRRKLGTLIWNDDNTCKAHCGERGSLMGGSLPWSSKRSITYLQRLKGSREYQAALTEWRTAKPGTSGKATPNLKDRGS